MQTGHFDHCHHLNVWYLCAIPWGQPSGNWLRKKKKMHPSGGYEASTYETLVVQKDVEIEYKSCTAFIPNSGWINLFAHSWLWSLLRLEILSKGLSGSAHHTDRLIFFCHHRSRNKWRRYCMMANSENVHNSLLSLKSTYRVQEGQGRKKWEVTGAGHIHRSFQSSRFVGHSEAIVTECSNPKGRCTGQDSLAHIERWKEEKSYSQLLWDKVW